MSLRTEILDALAPPPLVIEPCTGPGWAARCHVRRLDGPLMVEYLDGPADRRHIQLVVVAACDDRGTRIFQAQDAEKLAANDPEPLLAVWGAARKVNPYLFGGPEKNGDQAGDSATGSPSS